MYKRQSLNNDGSLRITPIQELQSLRNDHCSIRDLLLDSDNKVWRSTVNSSQTEIRIDVERRNADSIQINVLSSPNGEEVSSVIYDWSVNQLSIDTTNSSTNDSDSLLKEVQIGGVGSAPKLASALTEPPFNIADDEMLRLHIFVDRSIIEVFANDRSCLTTRIYPTRTDSVGVNVKATGGSALIKSLDIWDIKSIW